jgi:hypothetical protein
MEESLAASYQKRREIILENTAITEEQRLALLTKAETAYTAQVRKLEATQQMALLEAIATNGSEENKRVFSSFERKGCLGFNSICLLAILVTVLVQYREVGKIFARFFLAIRV